MQIWPFKPRDEVAETLRWNTDVFRAKAGEQRIALRTAPRREFSLDHLMNDQEYAAARAMMREAESFLVPDWPQSTRPAAISAGTSVVIAMDTTTIDLLADDQVMIWQGVYQFESATVTSLTDTEITVDQVDGNYGQPRVVPLRAALCPEGLSAERQAGGIIRASVDMNVYENRDLADTAFDQYRGHDVLPTCPVIASGSFSESTAWPLSDFDNDVGIPRYIRQRVSPDNAFRMRWHEFTRPGAWALRQWLHSRRGRQKVFWMSSWGKDLELAADIGSLDTTVRVYALPGITGVGRSSAFDIEIKATGGTRYYRQVSGLAVGPTINGRATLDLTIDSALGTNQLLVDTDRISFLRCARFNSDTFEMNHQAAAGVTLSVPCIEVEIP
ncbi:hypothetical protein [Marinobacter sp. JSM 1782161]|uniref:hypothetical protein n=1 Tax=Marinobacter sp. JSM 1782161 TaxID=2685906 RepID=UPI001403F9DA|nr:hypothetical protein [Marinobacter sp. JSM 1782161]